MSFRIMQSYAPDLDIERYAESAAITEVDLPALSHDDAARYRAIAAEARASAHDYARSFPSFSSASTISCPECDGTGVYLVGCIDPDDLVEQRCVVCLGAGVIDISEAVTQPLNWGKP